MSFLENLRYVLSLSENNMLGKLFIVGIILGMTVILAHVVNYLIDKLVHKILQLHTSYEMKKIRRTKLVVFKRLAKIFIYLLGISIIISMIPSLRALSYSFLAGAGVLAIIIGFAVQKAMSNIFSGFFLASYEPFRVGDKLKIENEMGIVEDITLRHTVIKTFDHRRLIIPNSKMDEIIITNYSFEEETIRWTIDISISYESSIEKAREIMLDEARKHKDALIFQELNEDGRVVIREPKAVVSECSNLGIKMKLFFWAKDERIARWMGYDLTESIKKRFDEAGIEIPYQYKAVVCKSTPKQRKSQNKARKHSRKIKSLRK